MCGLLTARLRFQGHLEVLGGPLSRQVAGGLEVFAAQSLTSLTGGFTDNLSISKSHAGELASASTRSRPDTGFLRRSHSSASTTTTASLPWTVTRCGPCSRARRASSLNRALASCSRQRPGPGGRREDLRDELPAWSCLSFLVGSTRVCAYPMRAEWGRGMRLVASIAGHAELRRK